MRRRLKIFKSGNIHEQIEKLPATGILMAGGKNSRMKKNKAFLKYQGEPLVARSLNILDRLFAEVLVSSNQPELYDQYEKQVIIDIYPEKGPIGGLHAGLLKATYDICFFVACDMPFIQTDIIRYLFQWTNRYEVVVPQGGKGLHPLHAYYNRSCLPYIEHHIQANSLKIINFYPECTVKYVEEENLRLIGDIDKIFKNVNTPEEWNAVIKNLE